MSACVEWRKVPSLNGLYEVSADGRVRNSTTMHELKTFVNVHGYMVLQVCPTKGERKTVQVHKLVAEAFLGSAPSGMVVNHKDGNKKNNFPNNLEYCTPSDNNLHALRNGLRHPAKMEGKAPVGENHGRSTITDEMARAVLRIREEKGYGSRRIAKELGISNGVTSGILYRNGWKHVNLKGDKN